MVIANVGYSEDLAYIHNEGFIDMARSAAATVLHLLHKQKVQNGLVVDLGCGGGVLAEILTQAGYHVLGIEISENMLKLARQRAPKTQFIRGSLFQAKLPECVAVTAIGQCVNYQFDRRSKSGLAGLFRRIYCALSPGGVFLFDVVEPGRVSKPPSLHFEGKDWAILVDKEEDIRRHVLTRRMTMFRKSGRLFRRSEEVHRQRLYPLTEIRGELISAGFRVRRLPGYGNEHFPSGRAAFAARKP